MSQLLLIDAIGNALKEATSAKSDDLNVEILLERPALAEHGDWSSNIALVVAKQLSLKPLDLASQLAEILNRDRLAHIERAEAVAPGFLNLFLTSDWLYEALEGVLQKGVKNFARHDFRKEGELEKDKPKKDIAAQKTLIEFVSANPTGPLHAGHAKGAVLGDSLARVLERCGLNVKTEFYVNDLGVQIENYVNSIEAKINNEEIPEDGYQGVYIEQWAEEFSKSQEPSKTASNTTSDKSDDVANDETSKTLKDRSKLRKWAIEKALADHKEVLTSLDIEFDNWFSESSLEPAIDKTLKDLKQSNAIYEKDGAIWLKTSEYGDDKDRVLVKSDGTATYLLPDIAYHIDKLKRADRLINIWGADHHGYVSRVKAAISALGQNPERIEFIISQLVRLESDGQEIKISKRTGDIIELRDLVEMLKSDAVRFTFLLHSPDSAQTVDLEKAAAKSMDNPVYYVQYAHTRICSILEKVETAPDATIRNSVTKDNGAVDLTTLIHPAELELIRKLSEMPDIVEAVAKELAPHRLTGYLIELAKSFHSFYHDCQVVGEGISPELTNARLKLIKAVQIGLAIGLNLCGVSAPKKM